MLIILAVAAWAGLAAGWLPGGGLALAGEPDWAARRAAMVEDQLRARGISDARVLAAMGALPRHLFVPARARDLAYADHPLPIGQGQTISQPYIVALMTQLLELKPGDKVLEIGTGSGYQAAVLAQVAGQVYSVEIIPELSGRAGRVLRELGLKNVHLRVGDGYQGWPGHAPFDAVMLTAAPPEVPPALIEQLAPGGRLIAPVGPAGGVQELVLLRKDPAGKVTLQALDLVRFVPMVRGGGQGR